MNINEWMVTHKYAANHFAASYIFAGLELAKVPRFWMRVKLVILYRLHRDSGEPSKVAYAKALTGKRPLMLDFSSDEFMEHQTETAIDDGILNFEAE